MNPAPAAAPPREEPKDNNGNVLDGLGTADLNDIPTAAKLLDDATKAALEHLGDIVDGAFSGLP